MTCECCWNARPLDSRSGSPTGEYTATVLEHERRGCICTTDTPEGRRKHAGQFWDEERQMDSRTKVKDK